MLIEGIIGVQKEAVLAAKRAIVTVEEIVPDFDDIHPNACILPRWTVSAIAVIPGGAHPSYTHGYYGRDNADYLTWDEISADRARFMTAQAFRPHVHRHVRAAGSSQRDSVSRRAADAAYDNAGWTLAFQMGVAVRPRPRAVSRVRSRR